VNLGPNRLGDKVREPMWLDRMTSLLQTNQIQFKHS